jgi:hypothetical protein
MRLQGVILYPAFVEAVPGTDEDGNETTQYKSVTLRVKDYGQNISDQAAFESVHYAELRQLAIEAVWPQHFQNEAWDESEFEGRPEKLVELKAFKEQVKACWPKPTEV